MNTIERSALNEGLALYDEMTQTVDERTLEIIERRRRTAVVRRRGWLVRRALMAADVIGLLVAFVLAELIVGPGEKIDMSNEVIAFLVTLPAWLLGAKLYGLYDHDEERTNHSTVDEFVGVFHLVTVGTWIFFIGSWLTSLAAPSLLKLVVFWGLGVGTISIGRATARAFCRHRIAYLQNTVILGAGEVGQLVGRKLMQHPEYGINLVGFVDAAPKERREDLGQMTVLGSSDRLPAIVRLFDIERVIVAFSNESHQDTLEIIRSLKDLDVQVDIVPRLFEIVGPGVGIHTVEGLPLVGLRPLRLSRSDRSSSARNGWGPGTRSSGSTSFGRCNPTRRSGSPNTRTSTGTPRTAATRGCSRCPATRASRSSGASSGATRWTSCPSSSTSFAGR
jgi:hypothetical protein